MDERLHQLCSVLDTFGPVFGPVNNAVRYTYDENFLIPHEMWEDSKVSVVNCDTLEAAMWLDNPLILILADEIRPGGNFRACGYMQEESLFLRSALSRYLVDDLYPIRTLEALFARDVPLLYQGPMDKASFIACPGIKLPRLAGGLNRLLDSDAATLRKKIELILQVAIREKHCDLVLGALRTGAWGCPSKIQNTWPPYFSMY
jgi:hypothetical protein